MRDICIVDYKFVYTEPNLDEQKKMYMSFTSDEGNWLQCHDAAAKFAKERITDKGFTLLYDEIMSTQSFVDRG